jgi:hypothetical protein
MWVAIGAPAFGMMISQTTLSSAGIMAGFRARQVVGRVLKLRSTALKVDFKGAV